MNTIYAVNESQGTVNFEVGVLKHQELEREVVVRFTTSDSTAVGIKNVLQPICSVSYDIHHALFIQLEETISG